MSYSLPNHRLDTSFFNSYGRSLIIVSAVTLIVAGCWVFHGTPPATGETGPADKPAPPPGLLLTFPTPQTHLDDTGNPAVFMPTESGKIESARYGSTRTRKSGKYFLPAFHEGIDIAPVERDSKGHAADAVFAVADGRVGYISRTAGNSSYGIYIVLLHQDPLGEYYTLYSHLASVPSGLKENDEVARGTEIGRIGNTSTVGIPVQRSHLHFEFGTIMNDRFGDWFRAKKLKPFHGRLHGYNLAGFNPADMFPYMTNDQRFILHQYITNVPVAFRLVVPVSEKPDYYRRYPALWTGGEPAGAVVIDVSESGAPLQARAATDEETAAIRKNKPYVLEAFAEVLGRNGERLVTEEDGKWIPGRNAGQWLEILLYQ
jgi:murein DD-endopeptidase MepM/ murein hydrolase activator NlpD